MDRIARLSLKVRIAEGEGDVVGARSARIALSHALLELPVRPGHAPLDPRSARFRGLLESCLEVADAVISRTQEILEMSFSDNGVPPPPPTTEHKLN